MFASALVLVALSSAGDFDAIVAGVSDRPHQESCEAMQQWSTLNPLDPRSRRGLVWCARLLWGDGRLEAARAVLERVTLERTDDEAAFQALATLGEVQFASGQYQQSTATYRVLAASSVELWRYTGAQALVEVERAQRVWLQALAICVGLAAWLLWQALGLRRALWPVPAEVWVLAPLFLLLSGVAFTQPPLVARALAALVGGGTALAWANGARWRARPPLGNARLVEALKGAGLGLLWLDVVLVSSGLWRPLWQSFTEGFP